MDWTVFNSSRGLVGVVAWALVVTITTTTTALELYDELPGDGDPVAYPDDNSLDTGPVAPRSSPELALAKDVLLYKLIKALQGRQSLTTFRSDWPSEFQPTEPEEPTRLTELEKRQPREHARRREPTRPREPRHVHLTALRDKDGVVKRLTNVLRGSGTNIGFKGMDYYRPQQKWKIKKGKALGSQMVCYFKLCAFRSPM
ncbi:uncharacterized protein LOC126371981 [Pectinophora gossypiella]|uniref:uncharacterized protein LOC126371981 n=1 Tax=Pectinophora gossypiella TaxID=13191 RepID=UPI00214F0136|nr:uncharacterized protein LOC126371981 [Pectinophora gossypiella]